METLDHQGGASLDHRGLTGRFYVEDNYTLLHTKCISFGPHGFREDLKSFLLDNSIKTLDFFMIRLWELLIPGAWLVCISFGHHVFREEDF